MIHKGYTLSPVTRSLPYGQRVEGVEIRSETRLTWAANMAMAKQAVDSWEKAKEKKANEVWRIPALEAVKKHTHR